LYFRGAFDDERQDFAIVFGEIIRAVLKITAAFVVVVSQPTDFISEEFDILDIAHGLIEGWDGIVGL
jgi:hypothetical protein